jgi:hypothetical protein
VASFAPLTRFGPESWGSTYLEFIPGYGTWSVVLATALLALAVAGLARRPVALVLFAVGAGGLLVFFYLKSALSLRHQGFLFVALAMALWLADADRSEVFTVAQRALRGAFPVLLIVHFVGGATAMARERAYVFSGASDTARLIRAAGLERLPMVVYPDYISSAVLAYLDKDQAYFPHGSRWGAYPLWDRARLTVRSPWAAALHCALSTESSVLVMVDPDTWQSEPPPDALRASIKPVGCRLGQIRTDESFCIAVLDRRMVPMWLERLARKAYDPLSQ